MNVEKLNYPWRDDTEVLKHEIEQLKMNFENLKIQNDNLKFFCHQLYDRLNLGNTTNSSPLFKPY